MDINFEYYKIFYYVAKYGNITKAAAALGGNQPNVTRMIRLLESQLNTRLLIREPRGIRLTEAGRQLYSHVEIACRHFMEAEEEIGGLDTAQGGTVEIGATETALHLFLIDVLYRFKTAYPAVKIKIHNSTTPETLKQLLEGRLDLALVTTPFRTQRNVRRESMLEFREILVGGPQYRDLCEKPLDLKDLKHYPLVGLGRGSVTWELYKDFFIRHKIDMDFDMEVATSDLMLPLLENNFGLGFVPEALALPLIREARLVQVHVNIELPNRSIELVSDRGRGRSLAADLFYKFLMEGERAG
ncbi:MAG: LysR family transcriptional regulator [Lachnospiraceae bacterium]|jgi:DNA-binding transcriptional LysR family regulator|nr:LysR family transcriptional regulator [Lachnospiraceae bacterium]